MVEVYVKLIELGLKNIEDVPNNIREKVKIRLNDIKNEK